MTHKAGKPDENHKFVSELTNNCKKRLLAKGFDDSYRQSANMLVRRVSLIHDFTHKMWSQSSLILRNQNQ